MRPQEAHHKVFPSNILEYGVDHIIFYVSFSRHSFPNLPAMSNYQALLDTMVQFYKSEIESANKRIDELQRQFESSQKEVRSLRRAFDRLEIYTNEQELRADVLHDVINRFIDVQDRHTARSLIEEMNQVAAEHDIDLEVFLNQDTESDSDYSTESLPEDQQ